MVINVIDSLSISCFKAFLTYLFSGSTIFLLYLQIELYFETQTAKKARRKILERDELHSQSPFSTTTIGGKHVELPAITDRDVEGSHTNEVSRNRHPSGHQHKPSDAESPCVVCRVADWSASPKQASYLDPKPHRRQPVLPPSSPLKEKYNEVDWNCQTPAAAEADSMSVYAPSCYDETYRRFVLLHNTAILKHEGASFYLRLGCMCKLKIKTHLGTERMTTISL